jgi:hypothetical protein
MEGSGCERDGSSAQQLRRAGDGQGIHCSRQQTRAALSAISKYVTVTPDVIHAFPRLAILLPIPCKLLVCLVILVSREFLFWSSRNVWHQPLLSRNQC